MESDKKDKIIADLSMKVIALSLLVFVLIIVFLIVIFHKPEKVEEQQPFGCGTAAQLHGNDSVSFEDTAGKKLFGRNCAVCHSLGTNRITGAGLEGIFTRIPSEQWLFNYIAHADKVYHSGDAYAVKLHKDFPDVEMPDFDSLGADKIKEIISYLKNARNAIP